ncbi:MAG: diaminopimelate epimerase [Coriobacteriaceae bacterium]|jgi:diaminopimelate epimerase|nr:diaminopimelate epimerase [Coriobacteriaceae bacterium]
MILDFVKLHGLGNDFIFIDDLSQEIELDAAQVSWLCDRHFGIGADGVILVRPSPNAQCIASMHYINSDGTLAEMCGNGVRCFAKYLVDRGFVTAEGEDFMLDTLSGPRTIRYTADSQGKLMSATVDMGAPMLASHDIPTTLAENARTPEGQPFVKEAAIPSPWGDFLFTCVSMGNPHAVCFIDDWQLVPEELFKPMSEKSLESFDIARIGSFYEGNPAFPRKANIEFAQMQGEGIQMRVYERGVGETLACGTGACATGVAAFLTARSGKKNRLHLPGGVLEVEWGNDGRVLMTGPAAEVYSGSVQIPHDLCVSAQGDA